MAIFIAITSRLVTLHVSVIFIPHLRDFFKRKIAMPLLRRRSLIMSYQVVVTKFATTTQHGAIEGKTQTHMTEYYNLDVIISGGYRVKSQRGIEFRRWANKVLKDYIIKGYAINDKRLEALQ